MKRRTTREKRHRQPLRMLAAGLAFVCGLVACTSNETILIDDGGINTGDITTKNVTFKFELPYSAPTTKAIGAAEEAKIDRMDVLAFKVETNGTETFDYHTVAEPATVDPLDPKKQTWTVKARVRSHEQRFVVITAMGTEVATLVNAEVNRLNGNPTLTPKTKTELLGGLKFALDTKYYGKWNAASASDYTRIPMWGESGKETINIATTDLPQAVSLLRMIARIDVQVDQTSVGKTKFALKSVHLYNTYTEGSVVPAAANLETSSKVKAPTVPSGAVVYKSDGTPLDYTTTTTKDVSMLGEIYTFEREAQTDRMKATCLVVGGIYAGDTKATYYRVDFIKDGNYLAILRNFRYTVNITKVEGRGYDTPKEAFESKPINMATEILDWNESGMNNITTDGQYTLAVDKDLYAFTKEGKTSKETDNTLNVWTDYTTGWKVEKYVNVANETQAVTWLQLNAATGNAGVTTETYIKMEENSSGPARSAKIILAAGRLRKEIVVTQSNEVARVEPQVMIVNALGSSTPVTELNFTNAILTSQTYYVKWQPEDAHLEVTHTTGANGGFTTTHTTGMVIKKGDANVTTHTDGYNYVAHTVAHPGIDPYADKLSVIEYKTTNHTGIPQTASIKLTHQNYAFTPSATTVNYGPLIAGTASFTFSTNTEWIATLSGELAIGSGVYASGGAGLNQTFNFPMTLDESNEKGKTKSLVVTFTSTTGRFTPVSVTITGEVPYLKLATDQLTVEEEGAVTKNVAIDTNLDLTKVTANITNNADGTISAAQVKISEKQLSIDFTSGKTVDNAGEITLTYDDTAIAAQISITRKKSEFEQMGNLLVGDWISATISDIDKNRACPAGQRVMTFSDAREILTYLVQQGRIISGMGVLYQDCVYAYSDSGYYTYKYGVIMVDHSYQIIQGHNYTLTLQDKHTTRCVKIQ